MSTDMQLREAERWAGSVVRIRSRQSGRIHCPVAVNGRKVVTRFDGSSQFLVEAIPDMPGVVAFRLVNNGFQVHDGPFYLTNIMYGDEHRQNVAAELARVPDVLPDSIGLIVDYAIERPTKSDNFEGAGYNYHPMTVQLGPPNKLQMFRLEPGIGVRSLFGTYWRSEWWNKVVSQSPHLAGDEMWYFERVAIGGMESGSESEDWNSGSESESEEEDSESEADSDMDEQA